MSITGDAGPTKVGVALVDVLTAKDATVGILAALRERDASGRGQHIEVNLLSSLLGSLVNQATSYLATGRSPGLLGNTHPSIAPYETLMCRDAALAVCCGNDRQFRRLAETVGRPELADDARFRTNADRVEHRPDLVTALEEALGADIAERWARRLTGVGVPAGCVGDIASALELADALDLAPLVDVGSEALPQVRNPVSYSRTPITGYRRPPHLGEHTELVRQRVTRRTTPCQRPGP